ncbi:Two-component system sensor histidine kinase [hydrothermal vent metagenome]|uniref:Two-component system sensor histidine kinase n=1 Tax=hydrothermal vent metagenome TaxID=652676 RepID=A0A3B0TF69_9ZZZZ
MKEESRGKFNLKIIFSYLVLAILAIVVGFFIYSEIKIYVSTETANKNDAKLLKTNALLTNLHEAESLSKLSLQSNNQIHFDAYEQKIDSVQLEIGSIKQLTKDVYQKGMLDSLQVLLQQKVENNYALRSLKFRTASNRYIDKALKEFDKIDESFGKFSAENLFSNFEQLSPQVQRSLKKYAALLSENAPANVDDGANAKYIDSILNASRAMLKAAKLKDSKSQRSLAKKEIEVNRVDLELSQQLHNIIIAFEQEVMAKIHNNNRKKQAALKRATRIAGFAALLGFLIVGLFSFLITRDYWKVQSYRVKLEKEKKFSESLLKSRERLISTVSHDLRTPLHTITGYTELMEGTGLSQKQERYLKNVKSASDYVKNLVNDLLDFSKLDGGKLNIEKVPFVAGNLIQETAETLQAIHSNKKIKLHLNIDPKLQKTVLGDPFRIRQILTNLIGNAFKFTEDGHIKITATTLAKRGKSMIVNIEIADTGIGIAKEKQRLIFNEFTQADSDTDKKFGGYGLGLTISKKLTELLKGKLTLESKLNHGSTFTIQLPLEITNKREATPDNSPYLTPKLRMLIIDDDTALLGMLRELGESMGMTVHTFSNFLQVETDSHLAYDLVLTDIQMPQITGFEVLKKLRSGNYKHYKKQPIIAMTGQRNLESEAYISIGFDQVLHKPFSKGELISMLKLLGFETQKPIEKESNTQAEEKESHVYSLKIIHSFLGTNEDAIQEVLQTFLMDTKVNMGLLEEGMLSEDYAQINQVAHRMLPMFRQLKVDSVVPILELLELVENKTMNKGQLLDALAKLRSEVDILTTALENRKVKDPSYSD